MNFPHHPIVSFGQINFGKVEQQPGEYNLHHRDGAMPLKTTTLAIEPVLVQQHELSIPLETTAATSGDTPSTAKKEVLSATILTYGATLTHLTYPDRLGQFQDVVLGFDHWRDYLVQAKSGALNPYFGGTIGRTASRIAHASFKLESKYGANGSVEAHHPLHTLQVSNGVDCHHGGPMGFDKQHWTTVATNLDDPSVTLELISPHGQNGYPGRLATRVKYMLTGAGELITEYWAQLEERQHDAADGAGTDLHSTIVSLTNHAYWNLDGVLNPPEGQVQDQGTSHPIPTGRILDLKQKGVESSISGYEELVDFTTSSSMGKRLGPGLDQIPGGYGYDHVYALDPPCSSSSTPKHAPVSEIGIQGYLPSVAHVATLFSPRTGIRLDLTTSEPALVVYAGGYLEKAKLPNTKSREIRMDHDHQPNKHVVVKAEFDKFAGISLEPIRYPDAIHHREWSKMVTLHHDQEYRQKSIYKFGVVPQTL
ncbi:hypothetical protein BGX34_011209 [Mortierella sp. NVP85]|nr:hypothetical protein BGX34_011209 [Mortierella sp. NVP85]